MEILLAVGLFGLAMLGMSLGVILSNRELQSSCGGVATLGEGAEAACGVCGKKAADLCPSDDELVRLAQIAHPNPLHHR
ncbi:MAG: (Na+)-NQR maturation NqrM [Alphaproteobacteria bacterium]|nr:(Na+)-NQR maturation NqrM [Alphaproteobacteria bacterium]